MSARRDLTGLSVRTYGLVPALTPKPAPSAADVNLRGCDRPERLTDRRQLELFAEYAELDGGTE